MQRILDMDLDFTRKRYGYQGLSSALLRIAGNLKQIPRPHSNTNLLSNDQSSASVNPSKSVPTLTLHPTSDASSRPFEFITQSLAEIDRELENWEEDKLVKLLYKSTFNTANV
jgi:hypothetical protein